jgi:hypothetical protein
MEQTFFQNYQDRLGLDHVLVRMRAEFETYFETYKEQLREILKRRYDVYNRRGRNP